MEENIDDKTIKKMEESIKGILNAGLTTANVDNLLKLSKIKHLAKEDKEMNNNTYGNYQGRNVGYDSYGNYGNYDYNRRGYDMRYRGHEHLSRIQDNYGRYEQDKERYGANEDTKRSLKYMLQSMEDFARMLREEAQSQEEVQMIKETAQRIANM